MKKISYLLFASCLCWVVGWTILTISFSQGGKSSPTEITKEKAPIKKELTSF